MILCNWVNVGGGVTLLSNFDPDKKTKVEDHIDDFYMHFRMLEVQFDDISCILFLYTLEGRASIWYHNFPPSSIHNSMKFKNLFLEKFVDDKTPSMLLKELKNLKMGDNEKVKDFN